MLFWVRAPLYTQASSLPACQSDAVLGPCSPVYSVPKQAHCQPANRMLFWVRAPLYTQASSLPACQSDAALGPCSPVYHSCTRRDVLSELAQHFSGSLAHVPFLVLEALRQLR